MTPTTTQPSKPDAAWRRPTPGPPGAQVSRDGGRVRFVHGLTRTPRVLPAPVLRAEVEPWSRPAATVAFPLHPAAVSGLFARAAAELDDRGVVARLDAEHQEILMAEVWRICEIVFVPGAPIRAALDAVLEKDRLRPDVAGEPDDVARTRRYRLAHLAAWAVFRTACSWVPLDK